MRGHKVLTTIAWVFFITNTVGILVLLELLLFRVPYLTLFLFCFAATLYINYKLFRKRLPF